MGVAGYGVTTGTSVTSPGRQSVCDLVSWELLTVNDIICQAVSADLNGILHLLLFIFNLEKQVDEVKLNFSIQF